jgi:serine protease Do
MAPRVLLGALWHTAIVLVAGASPCAGALAVQEALLRAKPAVVRVVAEVAAEVQLDCGDGPRRVAPAPFRETGSGWIIDGNGWIVTNGHVVQSAHVPSDPVRTSLTQQGAETACLGLALATMGAARDEDGARRRIRDTVVPAAKTTLVPSVTVILSNGVRLPAHISKYSPPVAATQMSSRDLALLKVVASDLPVLRAASSAKVLIGNPVHALGYPDAVLTHELLKQGSAVEATVTTGTVSGFKSDVAGHAVIQIDAPATWGNSGGPVLNADGDVIGVLTIVSMASDAPVVQGFNFIIPVADVLDFAQGTDIRATGMSKFNELWWAGLADFFQMNYRAAARKFSAADAAVPDLPDVKRMLAEARSRPTPLPWGTIATIVTSSSAALYAVLWVRRWQRNRFRISPAEIVRLMEDVDHPPLLLDVRAPAAYAQSPLKIPKAVRVNPDDPGDVQVERDRIVVAYCT